MIKTEAVFCLGLFTFLTLVFPILFILYCCKKNSKGILWVLQGILLFLLPQIIFRITLISKLQSEFVILNVFWIDLLFIKGLSSGVVEEVSKYIGVNVISHMTLINKNSIFKFFLGYSLCELFVFGLTGCRLFINALLIYFNVYPHLDMQSNEALLLIGSINQSLFIPMFFSLIERICTIFFHYFTINIIANSNNRIKSLILSIMMHTLFNIIGIFTINEVNPYFGRVLLIVLIYMIYRYYSYIKIKEKTI